MNEFLSKQLLKYRDILKVPLKYIDKKQAKAGTYFPVRERDENNYFITRHMTVDEEKYAEYREENDHILQFLMLENLYTIRKWVVFFAVLFIIGLIAEAISIIILIGSL